MAALVADTGAEAAEESVGRHLVRASVGTGVLLENPRATRRTLARSSLERVGAQEAGSVEVILGDELLSLRRETHDYTARGLCSVVAHEERGLALVLALLVVAAMSISTVALVGLVTSNETAFGRDRQEVRALNIGQSGLNYGVSYMQQYLAANDSTNGLAVGSTVGSSGTPMYSGAVDGGTMSWYATKTGSATWTIYANAVSPNGAVTRRLSLNMGGNVTTQTTTLTASPVYAYGYVMADPNADCAR